MKSDLDTLLELSRDYITSVQTSDVRRFDEILCTNPDGSIVDRDGFLRQMARSVGIANLRGPLARGLGARHSRLTSRSLLGPPAVYFRSLRSSYGAE